MRPILWITKIIKANQKSIKTTRKCDVKNRSKLENNNQTIHACMHRKIKLQTTSHHVENLMIFGNIFHTFLC